MSGDGAPESVAQAALERRGAVLGELLAERGWRMASAESCTGGWIAQAMTATAGSSAWFEGAFVTYSNAMKIALLGVDPMIIERHGAVSEACARAMVAGAAARSGAEVAVAVTGVAGPGGGSAGKPVGTVWFGFACDGSDWTVSYRFDGDREQVRAQTVAVALDTLTQRLN